MPEQRRAGKGDRTKNGATPKRAPGRRPDRAGKPRSRGEKPHGRAGKPRGRSTARAVLLSALGTALGGAVLVGGLIGLRQLAGDQRLPRLRMTVASCAVTGHGRTATTHCEGTADGGRPVRLDDAAERFAPGTVLAVRCTADGRCTAPSPGRWFVSGAVLLGGLLGTGAGLTALARVLAEAFAPERAEAPARPRVLRVLRVGAAAAAVLAVAASLVHAFTAN